MAGRHHEVRLPTALVSDREEVEIEAGVESGEREFAVQAPESVDKVDVRHNCWLFRALTRCRFMFKNYAAKEHKPPRPPPLSIYNHSVDRRAPPLGAGGAPATHSDGAESLLWPTRASAPPMQALRRRCNSKFKILRLAKIRLCTKFRSLRFGLTEKIPLYVPKSKPRAD